jgi:hypothetical protein
MQDSLGVQVLQGLRKRVGDEKLLGFTRGAGDEARKQLEWRANSCVEQRAG